MKLNMVQKCQLVGYLFLMAISIVEIILFCNILDVNAIGRIIAVVLITFVFNFSIWRFALKYEVIKRTIGKNDKSN